MEPCENRPEWLEHIAYIAEGVCEDLQIPGPTCLQQNPESLMLRKPGADGVKCFKNWRRPQYKSITKVTPFTSLTQHTLPNHLRCAMHCWKARVDRVSALLPSWSLHPNGGEGQCATDKQVCSKDWGGDNRQSHRRWCPFRHGCSEKAARRWRHRTENCTVRSEEEMQPWGNSECTGPEVGASPVSSGQPVRSLWLAHSAY